MKTILLAVLLMGRGSAMSPAADGCMHPDGVYLVIEVRTTGTCNDGFATPEPVAFSGWSARLHSVGCSDVAMPFTVDRCDHADWNLTCPEATYTGELHCVATDCDALEGSEHVRRPDCEGTLTIHATRLGDAGSE